ncbi:hypothetical protein I5Q34_26180 [Streptomyces sp. AV19]|uniref:hypothetical protein n=1 Tax=Streptomyces sp. AV19 TaxID=2793068 RepID=UPI0018FE8A09|nr:hypothetical protein [Streptomyces sp. AV19]MBH1937718.1 hypothetical protein [Streptomyces sp. AV19]MDG4536386.1 hypothetical protein [Streptomyces sp. AV19]
MRRIRWAALGIGLLTGTLIAGRLAYASDTVSFNVPSVSGECPVSWTKTGVTFQATVPGRTPSSFTLEGGTGTVDVAGDPIALALDPAKLSDAVALTVNLTSGFTLSDGKGNVVELSGGQAKAPTGGLTYLVRHPADPSGVRMAALDYPLPAKLNPMLVSTLPVELTMDATTDLTITPEFAKVLNDAFGTGSASGGQTFGSCTGHAATA